MDDNILIMVSLISFYYFYNSFKDKNNMIENMGDIKGIAYIDNINMKEKIPDQSFFIEIGMKLLNKTPVINYSSFETAISLENDEMIWNGKVRNIYDVVNEIQSIFKKCLGKDSIKIDKSELDSLKNKKDFIRLIPFMKKPIIANLSYDSIKCYIRNYEPLNLINLIKVEKSIPENFNANNIIFVNDYFYKISNLGIIKYRLNSNTKKNLFPLLDEKYKILNASLEATILNDINITNSTDNKIIIIQGEPYKYSQNKLIGLNDSVEYGGITKDNKIPFIDIDDDMESNYIDELVEDEDIEMQSNLIYDESIYNTKIDNISGIFTIDKVIYLIKNNKVYPKNEVSKSINNFINRNDILVTGVSPMYYLSNSMMNVSHIFHCKSSFYFTLDDSQSISELKDFHKDFGFKISGSLDYQLSCEQYNSFLSQLKIKNEITNKLKNQILTSLQCKFS